jgi:hypothetical protein
MATTIQSVIQKYRRIASSYFDNEAEEITNFLEDAHGITVRSVRGGGGDTAIVDVPPNQLSKALRALQRGGYEAERKGQDILVNIEG